MEARRGSGMYVCRRFPTRILKVTSKDGAGRGRAPCRRATIRSNPTGIVLFRSAALDPELFPHATWSRLLGPGLAQPGIELTGDPDSFGMATLEECIARHSAEWRGMDCDSKQIVVTSAPPMRSTSSPVASFAAGDTIWSRSPATRRCGSALRRNGLGVSPVRVDDEGFDSTRLAHHQGEGVNAKGAS